MQETCALVLGIDIDSEHIKTRRIRPGPPHGNRDPPDTESDTEVSVQSLQYAFPVVQLQSFMQFHFSHQDRSLVRFNVKVNHFKSNHFKSLKLKSSQGQSSVVEESEPLYDSMTL